MKRYNGELCHCEDVNMLNNYSVQTNGVAVYWESCCSIVRKVFTTSSLSILLHNFPQTEYWVNDLDRLTVCHDHIGLDENWERTPAVNEKWCDALLKSNNNCSRENVMFSLIKVSLFQWRRLPESVLLINSLLFDSNQTVKPS